MALDRRGFVQFLALIGAGAASRPEQVAAFEKYYDANTPWIAETGLVAVDEIFIGGTATASTRLHFRFYRTGEPSLNFAMNAFGGIIRWVAAPDQKIVSLARDFNWWVKSLDHDEGVDRGQFFEGHILYIDQEGVRHTHLLPGDGGGILGV